MSHSDLAAAPCEECGGRGEVLDAPADVRDVPTRLSWRHQPVVSALVLRNSVIE